MNNKMFVIFASEVIAENVNYLADNAGDEDAVTQSELLTKAIQRCMLEDVPESELDELANELMGWNIVAYADSDEFTYHKLANEWLDSLNK